MLELPPCFYPVGSSRRNGPTGSERTITAISSPRKAPVNGRLTIPDAPGLGFELAPERLAPWLRVFDGGKTPDPATHRAMADTVAWWRAERARHGWRADIMIETHDALCTTAAITQFLALAPGTAILWDAQHTWRNGGEPPLATWAAIQPHVVHIHVKDSISQPSARHPFSYVLPGEGEFAMAPLRAALQAEFHGTVSLEWERLWHPYLAPLDDALTAAAKRNWW